MKRYFAMLVGGLALILFSSTASALTTPLIECGAGASSVSFTGNPALSGQPVTLTCPAAAFTLPAGDTLTALTVEIVDDAQGPATVGSAVNWTWTETDGLGLGLNTVANETSTTGTTFNNCTNSPGPLVCDADVSVPYTGPVPTVTLTVSAAGAGGGISVNGGDSAELYIDYTYQATGTPEPATLSLVGGSLLALGMIARKRSKKA